MYKSRNELQSFVKEYRENLSRTGIRSPGTAPSEPARAYRSRIARCGRSLGDPARPDAGTMSSGGVPSDRAPPPARLFVVCGRGCASSELEALFAAFGVVRDVRYVEDKGVAYVEFSREDPFAAARALERFGANDDVSSSLEGGVASCREFLGGCERTIRIMRADDRAAPAGTPSNSVSVTREDETHKKEGSATADTRHRPRRLAEMETGSPTGARRRRRRRRRRGRPAAFAPFRGVPEDGVARGPARRLRGPTGAPARGGRRRCGIPARRRRRRARKGERRAV